MSGETSTLAEVIENTILSFMEGMHTCMPGRIESYDFKASKASVKPLLQRSYIDGTTLDIPILRDVPVIFPRTQSAGITFPVNRGDRVLIMFAERSLNIWKGSGENAVPTDNRKFDISDAICIPGLYSLNTRNIAKNNTDTVIHNDDQTITIKSNGDIDVGGDSVLKLVNESFKDLFNAHTHLVAAAPLVPPA